MTFTDPTLQQRWEAWQDDILRPLRLLYGERPDFDAWVARWLAIVEEGWQERSADLRHLDALRLLQPDWYQTSDQVGYICYADRFAGSLRQVADHIPYLRELGISYLHLMPLLQPRPAPNDGGYAVADYRQVDTNLGTMSQLAELAALLRKNGISLCTDLVCNHTAIEHEWAQKALAGDQTYQDYYLMFPDRTLPDQYERTLREIFPAFKRGNFLWHEAIRKWVWTTFHPYQWDLNYRNPAVFGEMLATMLYLANQGVEILRMDAVAFLWKEMGTGCENLPGAHALLQAWRGLTRLAAPGLLLKAEAIVSPELVVPYFGEGQATNRECELAYHNSLMVLLWSALAERRVVLLTHSLQRLPTIPERAAWATYVRCHDDIGWAITDENAAVAGLNGYWHRSFLSDFYSGQFERSFARGEVFQFNPDNNDRRISGSCASLAGLEVAIGQRDMAEMGLAIGRILLLHSVILACGGIPLLYMGDELGLLNDYSYRDDLAHADDNRWLHRPIMNWQFAALRHETGTIPHRLFSGLQQLIAARKRTNALHARAAATPVWMGNDAVFGLLRHSPRGRVLVLANFTEQHQTIPAERLQQHGFGGPLHEQINEQSLNGDHPYTLAPYQSLWLTRSQ
jgi:amylosucrase